MKLSINKSIFNYITTSPSYIKTKKLTLIYRCCENNCLGFIVPRALGAAHKRNLFRRRCRNAFHQYLLNNDQEVSSVGVIMKPLSIDINYNQISNIFHKLSDELMES